MEGGWPTGDAARTTTAPMAAGPPVPQEQNVGTGATTNAGNSNAAAGQVEDKVLDEAKLAVIRRVELSEEQREKVVALAKEAEEKGLSGYSDLWPYTQTMLLIEIWGQVFVAHDHVNLKAHHWKSVLEELNKQVQSSIPGAKIYSLQQAHDRIELLKRNHKKEADKKTASGSVTSKWAFFHAMNEILGTSSKVNGVPGAFTGQRAVPMQPKSSNANAQSESQGRAAIIDLDGQTTD
jgi:hypothetical protein